MSEKSGQSARDLYRVLGIRRNAAPDQITKAYRKLAMQYHPDRNVGDVKAEVRFKEVTEAYEVLRDAERRQRYDETGDASAPPTVNHELAEMMQTLVPVLMSVVQQIAEQGGKVSTENVLEHMRKVLTDTVKAAEKTKGDVKKLQVQLLDAAERFTPMEVGADNELAAACRSQANLADKRVAEIEKDIERTRKGLEYLKKYGYTHVQKLAGGFGSTAASGAWHRVPGGFNMSGFFNTGI